VSRTLSEAYIYSYIACSDALENTSTHH